jgi:hypothetical protein
MMAGVNLAASTSDAAGLAGRGESMAARIVDDARKAARGSVFRGAAVESSSEQPAARCSRARSGEHRLTTRGPVQGYRVLTTLREARGTRLETP